MGETLIDADLVLACAAVLTAVSGLLVAFLTQRRADAESNRTAKKDELELLRAELADVHSELKDVKAENKTLHLQVTRLMYENLLLRSKLAEHGIAIPELDKRDQQFIDGVLGLSPARVQTAGQSPT